MSLRDAVAKVSDDRTSTTPAKTKKRIASKANKSASSSPTEQPWDERMKRHTFHISVEQLDEMRAVAQRNGLSLTQLLHDALEAHLPTLK